MVTDHIDTFTATGIRLASGRELAADVVVTATGLNLLAFGGIDLVVDGERRCTCPTPWPTRGCCSRGVPNFAYVIGYTNASWTLKADLVSEYVCRLLAHLRRAGSTWSSPRRTRRCPRSPSWTSRPATCSARCTCCRSRAPASPWRLRQNYLRDAVKIRRGGIEDGALRFSRAGSRESSSQESSSA